MIVDEVHKSPLYKEGESLSSMHYFNSWKIIKYLWRTYFIDLFDKKGEPSGCPGVDCR